MIGLRRFWTAVAVEPEGGGFGLRLDARLLRTPAGAPLRLPTHGFACAIADEWRAVGEQLRPEALPLTRAANVAIDRIAPAPEPVVAQIAAYGAADLLCYRAEEPQALRDRQGAGWDPLLAWSAEALGAALVTAEGVIHRPQPEASLARLRARVAAQDAFALAALHEMVTLSGSLVLALAVADDALEAAAAWDLSRIDEDWQAEHWGLDAEAEAAAAARRAAFLRAALLLELLAEGDRPASPA